jgi:hypothetical protein
MEMMFKQKVPSASNRRNRPVSSLKAMVETVDQKNALNPKAARGNAVAVPRWSGKLDAAVLMEAEKAEQLPKPVRKTKKDKSTAPSDPSPCS